MPDIVAQKKAPGNRGPELIDETTTKTLPEEMSALVYLVAGNVPNS
jgi:hypothetical protein